MGAVPVPPAPEPTAGRPGLLTIAREWGRIGCIGFGGPPTHIRLLRDLCVDRRQWLDAREFEDALAACNLLPGPASTQLAIFCAWRLRGRPGALLGGAAFILPGLLLILALAALFLSGAPPRWIRGAGAGAGAAVAAVAVQAGASLVPASWSRARQPASGSRPRPATADTTAPASPAAPAARQPARPARWTAGPARWTAYLAAGAAAAATIGPWLVLVLLACGLIELAAKARQPNPASLDRDSPAAPGAPTPGPDSHDAAGSRPEPRSAKAPGPGEPGPGEPGPGEPRLDGPGAPDGGRRSPALLGPLAPLAARVLAGGTALAVPVALSVAWVALKVGALSYGGGFVIIPLMQADAVSHYHWMTGGQFLNAVALGQVTPGPVVQTVAVVGYAAAGIGGGLLAAVVAFAPSFAFVLLGARHFGRLRDNPRAAAFLGGAGPAAIGAILGSAIPLARTLAEPWQYAVLAAAAAALFLLRRGVVLTLLAAGAAGTILALAGAALPR
jgi:chromate transporter